jgi:hypothetical protein
MDGLMDGYEQRSKSDDGDSEDGFFLLLLSSVVNFCGFVVLIFNRLLRLSSRKEINF